MKHITHFGVTLLACLAWAQLAQASGVMFTPGSYVTQDGNYTVQVLAEDGKIVIVEPNARSAYDHVGSNAFEVTSRRGIRYGVRVLDTQTLQTYKPNNPTPPTLLRLIQASGPAVDVLSGSGGASASASNSGAGGDSPSTDPYPVTEPDIEFEAQTPEAKQRYEVYEKYRDLAKNDNDNAHAWAACGAAALAKATYNEEGFRKYAQKVAASLKPIMVEGRPSPCPELFSW